jgi:hypothetical protein
MPEPEAPRTESKFCLLCQWCGSVKLLFSIAIICVTISLLFVMLSTPIIKGIYIFSFDVPVGEVRGRITLGTFGYCLEVANKTKCTSPKLRYVVGQFPSNHWYPVS